MNIRNNLLIAPKNARPFLADAYYQTAQEPLPLVIFAHGYKGFKDWGAWHLVAEAFARAGYFFVKFNFSHNGTTVKDPLNFSDLEAFGNNNYEIELEDLQHVIQHFSAYAEVDSHSVALIGHSRGGAMVLLKAAEEQRVKAVATWAGVSNLAKRFPKDAQLKSWREQGMFFVENARTHQKMPHYYQFYESYVRAGKRLHIEQRSKLLTQPLLIVHGTEDEAVPIEEAHDLKLWHTQAQLAVIEKANHTFGATHPWWHDHLPTALHEACTITIAFLAKHGLSPTQNI